MLQLNKEGLSLRKIADETGISKSTVSNILKKHKDQVSNVHAETKEDGQLDSGQKGKRSNYEDDDPTVL